MAEHLLQVEGLKQHFPIKTGFLKKTMLKAVDGVSFTIDKGETLGLVGESGCGKTTVGRSLLRLYKPTAGVIRFKGEEITDTNIQGFRRQMQVVFQDPYSSLNPRMTVADIVGEPLDIHRLYKTQKEREEKIVYLLQLVGLNSDHSRRYAHEFSGGQRQRIGIARALAVDPEFIVCDEPVSALDVSIQAQVINTFEELQQRLGLAYLFIAHDLHVVHHMSRRIAVMYLGKIVETAVADDILARPMHPYTQSLISAIPIPDPKKARLRKRIVLEGEVPSPLNLPSGCSFRTRCRYATEQCAQETPELRELAPGHEVSCWNPQ
ncbi:MAG: ABC transporter ATP-binding protein [Eubacteriales bacterium]|jgi:oligopeptide transport system ATP-binding protein|nr:ABC transporter ATP-binding protein [Eubacteriales bacterium]MDD3109472.1 ABC transporter ATP-binding protein [Eubacteriales bacterium]MDD3572609.1 ABC transporter ATP-binding protein [Eubacteriales bacterium]MDD4133560.1 ABC transporter ATP-binding protein [Eubacteriales bacterium]